MIGLTVSHYQIEEKLGGGGMGVVYRARDTRLDRDVALKFLPDELTNDAQTRARFELEARAASALDHAHICTIYEIGGGGGEAAGEQLFIAMAFYAGQTLKARLRGGPLPVNEAIRIARDIATGLEHAHQHGIVHRDIKPANVMVTDHGEVKILDFGIAKLASEVTLTRTGESLGTPAYMAPEQIAGDEVTAKIDLWGLGCLLYEMVSGRTPFARSGPRATVAAILGAVPEPLAGDLPEDLRLLVAELLEKSPDDRPGSAGEVAIRLTALLPSTPAGSPLGWFRTPVGIATSLVVLAAMVAMIVLPMRRRAQVDAARASVPDIEALAAEGSFEEAFALLEKAESVLGHTPELDRLVVRVSDRIDVTSDPPGATVHMQPVGPDLERGPRGRLLGATPLRGLRVPRGDYYLYLELAGHEPAERLATSSLLRSGFFVDAIADSVVQVHAPLDVEGAGPADMVPVPGGPYTLVGSDAPAGATVDLEAFRIDRYEVTNARFREFVRAGGYQDRSFWTVPFQEGDDTVPFEEAMARFTDRTGLPGPRNWVGQEYPEGQGDHPVTGVTWYEAAAYSAFVGKTLPTVFQWEKAARDGRYSRAEGQFLPWGYTAPGESIRARANFSSTGTQPVGALPGGLSPFGVFAMAGNVKEWTRNPGPEGFVVIGGGWEDPPYVFAAMGSQNPFFSSPSLGFRLVSNEGTSESARFLGSAQPPDYRPVDDATFEGYLTHYRYDRIAPDPEIVERHQAADWVREKIRILGLEGPILAYLYLPRSVAPPYQTIVFVPSRAAFLEPMPLGVESVLASNIRAGRAVLAVVLKGMVEREWDPGYELPAPTSVRFRDLMALHATELRLGIDYLVERDDIDSTRLAYLGLSFGAGSRSVFAALDDRFRAAVFMGAGIDERIQPTLPEANSVNFLPRVSVPKLVLNGAQDEEHPWRTRGQAFWNLLREPKELVLVPGAGHLPPDEARTPAINAFLDRTLGPVR